MRKDGIVEAFRSSRLVISDAIDPNTELASQTHSQAPAVNELPRVVSDARTATTASKDGLRGMPKSGRVWKRVKNERFSRIRHDKSDRTSWALKQSRKAETAAIKSLSQQLKEETAERRRLERERVDESRKRKLENEKKNEIVVPIKNVAKIKRMKKKQLRTIKKQ